MFNNKKADPENNSKSAEIKKEFYIYILFSIIILHQSWLNHKMHQYIQNISKTEVFIFCEDKEKISDYLHLPDE